MVLTLEKIDLCVRKRWEQPHYTTIKLPAGYTSSVSVHGRVFTGLLSTSEGGAREYAASTALHYIPR